MNNHYEICKLLVQYSFRLKRSYSSQDSFMFELTYANYQTSCEQCNIKALPKSYFLGNQPSMGVIFINFK